jgi:hypothetical protein
MIIVSLIAFSQTDTTPTTKCFPIPVVKLIAKDLLSGDSAKALLKLTEEHVDSLTRKTYIQDSVIGVHLEKERNFNTVIGYERDKFGTLQTYTNKIELDLKTEKTKSKLLRWANYGLVAVLGITAFILK